MSENVQHQQFVRTFAELAPEQQHVAGGKGGALARLFQHGFPVPDGFVILPAAFADDALTPDAWEQVETLLDHHRRQGEAVSFAVRSSAMSEDSAAASFAGEFETVLNVRTDGQIRTAIQRVYRSRQNERVRAYSAARGMSTTHDIAVVIQRLVPAERSGILFTANPISGERDQAVISASWGLGEAIVGGLVTPDTLIVAKDTGVVLSRETADKQVKTVLTEDGTQELPTSATERRAPVLNADEAAQLVRMGVEIETLYGMPMDIEWALANAAFAILQARPITALPEPEPPAPAEWKLPKGKTIAMRNNIVELMADPLTPLFNTLGRSAINTSMGRLLGGFFGAPDMVPDELIISVNHYAYYNGSWNASQIAKIVLSSGGIMKRMFTGAVERWVEDGRPRYVATVARWSAREWRNLPACELLDGVRELSEAAIDAYGALVSGVIPAAWISEGLFTLIYNTLVKRRGDPPAPTFLLGFDSMPMRSEKSLFDLAEFTRARAELREYVLHAPTDQIVAQLDREHAPAHVGADVDADTGGSWREWRARFQTHLERYGHAIYNLDFANPVAADDPAPVVQTLKLFISGEAADPYQRQEKAAARREEATQAVETRMRGLRLKLFRRVLNAAQRYAPLREDGLADIGLGYPLLRRMLCELGRRFAAGGVIADSDDVFWLTEAEVRQAAVRLDQGEPVAGRSDRIPGRRAELRAAGHATPPLMLPQINILGLDIAQLKTARKSGRHTDVLKGVAASPGSVTAPARVLHGPEDFAQMSVLGTGSATRRIQNGQMITVDGSAGIVHMDIRVCEGSSSEKT